MTEPQFTIEELANEEWRDIPGYEGRYQVSNLGRIFTLQEIADTFGIGKSQTKRIVDRKTWKGVQN